MKKIWTLAAVTGRGLVQARRSSTSVYDSLNTPWLGRLFVNSPDGCEQNNSMQAQVLAKAVHEQIHSRAVRKLLLLKDAIGYQWFEITPCLFKCTNGRSKLPR